MFSLVVIIKSNLPLSFLMYWSESFTVIGYLVTVCLRISNWSKPGLKTELYVKLEIPYTCFIPAGKKMLSYFSCDRTSERKIIKILEFILLHCFRGFSLLMWRRKAERPGLCQQIATPHIGEDQEADSSELEPELNTSNQVPSITICSLCLIVDNTPKISYSP